MRIALKIFPILLLTIMMQGCFTGIESTPRITRSDVKKEHIVLTEEQKYMDDITVEKPRDWEPGKKFYVTDGRIALAMSASQPIDTIAIAGSDIMLESVGEVISVTGDQNTVFTFSTGTGVNLIYRVAMPLEQFRAKESFDIPFAIDRLMVDAVRQKLTGNRYYITTPLWYDSYGQKALQGQRHVPVEIVDVVPGNEVYPLRIKFRRPESDQIYSVYMTIGHRRTSTQNFDTLLSLSDPKLKYPQITEDVWQLIVNSRVKEGMTKTECRLALGAPTVSGQRPIPSGMIEYWSYSDGIYLIFEEGYLTSYRR